MKSAEGIIGMKAMFHLGQTELIGVCDAQQLAMAQNTSRATSSISGATTSAAFVNKIPI